MGKVFWCFTGAGALLAGVLLSASYYASANPETTLGHCINTVATASVALEPITALASRAANVSHHAVSLEETTTAADSSEECIPEDPQPVAVEPAVPVAEAIDLSDLKAAVQEAEQRPAPIVISEDEPIQRVEEAETPSAIEIQAGQGAAIADERCPMVMPYCTDDDPSPRPNMPYADAETRQADGSEASEEESFKAWMKLFKEPASESKPSASEELPVPVEDIQAEPKCQEDCHRHEHFSGCPHMTCPFTGKTYPCDPPSNKAGKEETSEEPEMQPRKHGKIVPSNKDRRLPTEGVDTMEYRPSDGGLNEFGPGPF
jgi:hypothetical protein